MRPAVSHDEIRVLMSTPAAVRFDGVTKRFPGVTALDTVTFEIAAGTVHALCGENGAGKSTLGKLLAGIYAPDAGQVVVNGTPVRFTSPTQARAAGVAMVHQEIAFCENLSVAENLCLGALPSRAGFVSRRAMRQKASAMLAAIQAPIHVDATVGDLTIGQQQLVQIAGAISGGANVIIFDEPTSSISQYEAERLYGLIDDLRRRGVTCIYVSHRLEEIFRLCDVVTVLRDGKQVATAPVASLTRDALVEQMIGRSVEEYFPHHLTGTMGPERLRVEQLSGAGFEDVSFSLRAGEVLGLAGLVGAGRSELARAIFGIDRRSSGRIFLDNRLLDESTPAAVIARGIGLVPEDRKRQGLVLSMGVLSNATLSILPSVASLGFIRKEAERTAALPNLERLRTRTPTLETPAGALSGGNQQKIVVTKWLAARCPVLIIDEPTRGVDVGAKAEIHALIDELAASGTAVLLISSEMPEILGLSTRILVFRGGRIVGDIARKDATQEAILRLMAGVAA
jgi:ABC-type sugar transport system ATPase subunit